MSVIRAEFGDTVRIYYKISFQNGKIYDQKWGDEKGLVLTLGKGLYIKGFEDAVVGMALGDIKKQVIPFYNAFGPKDPLLISTISKTILPHTLSPFLGRVITITAPDGQQVQASIIDIQDKTITLDANPSVANQDLICEIELLEILIEDNFFV